MDGRSAEVGTVTLYLFGSFELRDATGQVTAIPGGRSRLLLQQLATRAPSAIDPRSLETTLWPSDPPPSAARTLASLVSRLRAILGPHAIGGSPGTGYALTIDDLLTTDLAWIERLASEAQARVKDSPALTVSASQTGLDAMARGALFGGQQLDTDWFDELERRVDALRRRLQRLLWEGEAQLEQWDQVIDRATAVLTLDSYDEEAARALMTAYWHAGDRGSALHTYETLRHHLDHQLQTEPSPETDALFHQIATTGLATPPRPAVGSTVGTDLSFVGRQTELATLMNLWAAVGARQPRSVVITGPLGSGRTRLATEFGELVRRAGANLQSCECYEAQHSAFLQPILHVLGRAVLSRPRDEIVQLAGRWLDTLAELIPEVGIVCDVGPYRRASPDLEHRRALQMVVHVIAELARDQPLVLVFDDLHHSGASTIEALQWIIHELPSVPVMVLATTAPEHDERELAALRDDSATITLAPLSRSEVDELAKASGHDSYRDLLWELTHGQVLFVVEIIASLDRGIEPANIARSLSKLVLDRVKHAGPDTERILRAAAVVGQSFDVKDLEKLLGDEADILPVLLDATTDGLIEPFGSMFVFANRVIRDALYETTLGPIKTKYHRALADMVDDPWSRALHLEGACDYADAARAWIEAAEAARRSFANHDAAENFGRAAAMAKLSGDEIVRAEALLGRGAANEEIGNYDLAAADHREAERIARAVPSHSLLARSMERLGWTAYYARDVEAAHDRALEAAAMPGAHPSAWVLAGRIHHWSGDFKQATAAYETALDHSADLTDDVRASALSCLGALLEHSDHYDDALRILDEAVDLSQNIGAFRPLLRALFFQGIARANAGNLVSAMTALEMKATLLDRYEVGFYRARTQTCLAWVWRELGEQEKSRSLSESALDESRRVEKGELQVEQELHALCSLAECDLLEGRSDAAAANIAAARQLLAGWLPFRWRAQLRVLDLETRLGLADPAQLLSEAEAAKSVKYQALAMNHAGNSATAMQLAGETGSLLLLAEVGPLRSRTEARNELATQLPQALRRGFVTDGRLAKQAND